MPKNVKTELKLSDQLILNQYILSLFEVDSFEDLTKDMKDASLEELDSDNISRFYKHLSTRLIDRESLGIDVLRQYDENIVNHTIKISNKRNRKIKWKYFQYLSLLFSEIYLDKYFNQTNEFLTELNLFVDKFNKNKPKIEKLDYYDENNLKKLAFWNATGSGKTLIMHVNILQYLHYFHKSAYKGSLENIILLTPSEDLSKQHLKEFELSGLQSALFNKDMQGVFRGKEISIIDIHKLRDEMGERTVAIDSFEGNNLVLVDEGHRGSSGAEWRNKRVKLSKDGFAFEYSATFGQAVSGKPNLIKEYAKSIVFDYSYPYFYDDGYGKDYRILNLREENNEQTRYFYLLACLTTFYQQIKIYNDNELEFQPFMIEKPLWIFVGGSVNALRTLNGRKISDVIDILLFIANFVSDEKKAVNSLNRLLSGKPGLLDEKGNEIFSNSFSYLIEQNLSPEKIYKDILSVVFNSSVSNSTLYIENLKGIEGEIALRLGQNEPFGLINVGDTNELSKLCANYNELFVTNLDFSKSYFQEINETNSSINILIGSKKFIEGWSSWRVSTMGLMNLGRSEGSQIIQLFGRGIRLKGYDFGLKRSEALINSQIKIPKNLKYLETLNIFGIRADYMQQFKEYLDNEGIHTEPKYEEIYLPILNDYKEKNLKLKGLRLKKGVNYKKQAPKPKFKVLDKEIPSNEKIVVNWYPKLQMHDSRTEGFSIRELYAAELNKTTFTRRHVAFMDLDYLYFEIQKFKKEKEWHNLILSKESITGLLLNNTWYIIEIPKEELFFDSYEKVGYWEEIALVLLKKYCEKQYLSAKKSWEAPHMEYYNITEKDKNFISEYKISVDINDESMVSKIKQLKSNLHDNRLGEMEFGSFTAFSFTQHLYHPLIRLEESIIKVFPAALNEGEYNFVNDLKIFFESTSQLLENKKLYLLRNQSKGKGIGFFEAGGFYPDFILWILDGEKQYITFVDPKGIRNHSITDSKLQFYRYIKELEKHLDDNNVKLNGFIISNTSHSDILNTGLKLSKEEMKKQHIMFQNEDKETYIKEMIGSILANN